MCCSGCMMGSEHQMEGGVRAQGRVRLCAGAVPLLEGLAKCTLVPAQILEASTPDLRQKGRLQVGCDADIAVFDWQALTDRAEFKAMNRAAAGMRHVLVHGTPVIADGALVPDARPGRPVRRPVSAG